MNRFITHSSPYWSATSLPDCLVVKMPLEETQMLSTHARLHLGMDSRHLYKPTHAHHPCVKWLAEGEANVVWAIRHGINLCREYTLRYGRRHACQAKLEWLADTLQVSSITDLTVPPRCMPVHLQHCIDTANWNDVTVMYRRYIAAKHASNPSRFTWKRSPHGEPDWLQPYARHYSLEGATA